MAPSGGGAEPREEKMGDCKASPQALRSAWRLVPWRDPQVWASLSRSREHSDRILRRPFGICPSIFLPGRHLPQKSADSGSADIHTTRSSRGRFEWSARFHVSTARAVGWPAWAIPITFGGHAGYQTISYFSTPPSPLHSPSASILDRNSTAGYHAGDPSAFVDGAPCGCSRIPPTIQKSKKMPVVL